MQMKKFPIMFYIIFNKSEMYILRHIAPFCCKSIKKELNSCYEFI